MDFNVTNITADPFEESDYLISDLVEHSYNQYSREWHFIWTLPFHCWLGLIIGLGISLAVIRCQDHCFNTILENRVVAAKGKIHDVDRGKMTYSFRNYSQSDDIATGIVGGYTRNVNDMQFVPDEIQKLIIGFIGHRAFYEHVECQRRIQLDVQPDTLHIKYDPDCLLIHYRQSEVPICWTGRALISGVFYVCVIRGSALAFVSLVYGVVIAMTQDGYPWDGFLATAWTVGIILTVTVVWIFTSYSCCLCNGSIQREIKVGEEDDENEKEVNGYHHGRRPIDIHCHMDGHNDTVHLEFNRDDTIHHGDRGRNHGHSRVRSHDAVYEPLRIMYS